MSTTAKAPWEEFSPEASSSSQGASAPWEQFEVEDNQPAPWEAKYAAVEGPDESEAETKRLSRQAAQARKPTTRVGKIAKGADDFVRGVADTVTFGFADELAGKVDSLFKGTRYEDEVAAQRQRDAEGGYARTAGQVTGAFVPGAAGVKAVTRMGVTNPVKQAGLVGGASGVTYGAGSSEADTAGGVALDAAEGGLYGLAGGAVVGKGIDVATKVSRGVTFNPVKTDMDAFAKEAGVDVAPNFKLKRSDKAVDDPAYGQSLAKLEEAQAAGNWNGVVNTHRQLSEATKGATGKSRDAYAETLTEYNKQLKLQAAGTSPQSKVAQETIENLKIAAIKDSVPYGRITRTEVIKRAAPQRVEELRSQGVPENEIAKTLIKENPMLAKVLRPIKTGKELRESLKALKESPNWALFTDAERKRMDAMIKSADPVLTRTLNLAASKLPGSPDGLIRAGAQKGADYLTNTPWGKRIGEFTDSYPGLLLHAVISPISAGAQATAVGVNAARRGIAQKGTQRMLSDMRNRPTPNAPTREQQGMLSDLSVGSGLAFGLDFQMPEDDQE